jgi:hypothetical protein
VVEAAPEVALGLDARGGDEAGAIDREEGHLDGDGVGGREEVLVEGVEGAVEDRGGEDLPGARGEEGAQEDRAHQEEVVERRRRHLGEVGREERDG